MKSDATVKTALRASVLLPICVLALFAVVFTILWNQGRYSQEDLVRTAQAKIIGLFSPYRVVIESARWPLQRLDSFQRYGKDLTPEQLTDISSQLLQVSFGFDYEFFALRQYPGTTLVEIRRGVLSQQKHPVQILGEEQFDEKTVGMIIRPCSLSDTNYLCILDFANRQRFIPAFKRGYTVIAIPIDDFVSRIRYSDYENSWFSLTQRLSLLVGGKEYPIYKDRGGLTAIRTSSLIDSGVSLTASLTWFELLAQTISFGLAVSITLFIGYAAIAWRTRKKIQEKIRETLILDRLHRLEAVQTLARGVIHDIRSPLAALKSCVEDTTDKDARSLLRHVTKRLEAIIHDLEQRGRLDTPDTEQVALPLEKILKLLVLEKSKEYASRSQLRFVASSQAIWVRGSYSGLLRMMSNLINNAVEASPEGNGVSIHCDLVEANKARIQIVDRGVGIPQNLLSGILEEGVSYRKPEGMGIGLPRARQIVEKMGGSLVISSHEGSGTTVIVELPTIPQPSWAIDRIDLTLYRRVVVVDDEEDIARSFWTEKIRGLPIETAYFKHTAEFEQQLEQERESLVFLDNRFGNEDDVGVRFLRQHPELNCVLLTTDWQRGSVQAVSEELGVSLIGKEFLQELPVITRKSVGSVPLLPSK